MTSSLHLRPFTVLAVGVAAMSAGPEARAANVPVQVDAGIDHSCVVTSCGSVRCWGRDDYGQARDRIPTRGYSLYPQAKLTSVTVGSRHTCALNEFNRPECWGRSYEGQISVPTGTFTQLDAGRNQTCGIRTNGTLACWGMIPAPPSGLFKDLSVGHSHACAVTQDGSAVRCWGNNSAGQAMDLNSYDLPSGELFREVEAGAYHTCARSAFNRVYCWGSDTYGAVTNGGRAVRVSTAPNVYQHGGSAYSQLSAGRWGTIVVDQTYGTRRTWAFGWPFSGGGSYAPPSASPKSVDAGSAHACMITDSDQLLCWGSNGYSQQVLPEIPETCPGLRVLDPTTWPSDPIRWP